jgi:hypothetical protein
LAIKIPGRSGSRADTEVRPYDLGIAAAYKIVLV